MIVGSGIPLATQSMLIDVLVSAVTLSPIVMVTGVWSCLEIVVGCSGVVILGF